MINYGNDWRKDVVNQCLEFDHNPETTEVDGGKGGEERHLVTGVGAVINSSPASYSK